MTLEQFLKEAQRLAPGHAIQVSQNLASEGRVYAWDWAIAIVGLGNYETLCGGLTAEEALAKLPAAVAERNETKAMRIWTLKEQLAKLEAA